MPLGPDWKIKKGVWHREARLRGRCGTASSTPFSRAMRHDEHPTEKARARAAQKPAFLPEARAALREEVSSALRRPGERTRSGHPSNSTL